MKRTLIGILVVVVVVGLGIGYKVLFTGHKAGGSAASSGGNDLTFAKAAPVTLPPVSGYQLKTVDLGDGPVPLITVPLDTWGGYAALFAANNGLNPNKDSAFYRRGHFAVQIVREELSDRQIEGFASGKWPIIWTQMDGLPLFLDAFKADKRVSPKVLGLFDWSDGGDGILVRNSIRSGADLKGKIVVTSSNTPYSFMLLWYLGQNGLTGNDVKVAWIDDGVKALKVFQSNPNVAAWVSWTPYITDATDPKSPSYVPDARLIISSKDANQVIADCYMVRSDLLQDKPEMMQAFVEAMMDGSQQIGTKTYNDMAAFYTTKGSPVTAADAKSMLDDVHIANFPENKMFFDPNNSIGAYKVFHLAQEYYKQLGALAADASYEPERVLTPKIIAAIDKKGEFASQKNAMANSFNKKASLDINDLENQRVVLKNSVELFFEAQKLDFDIASSNDDIRNNMKLLGQVAEQTKFLATTIVKLAGYLDTAKVADFKAQGEQQFIEASAQAKLISKKRAEFVKSVLVKQYGVDPDRVITEGKGWDNPISDDPNKNRRVEVSFISLE
jgi:NitT/TauT family transport system substrate-binding protein